MPAPARISVPVKQPTPLKSTTNSIPKTPSSNPQTKGRVVHRRRARGRLGDTESDDELVREPHSDSDSESAASTLDSESISESELENEVNSVPSPSQTPLIATASVSTPPSHSSPNPVFFPPSRDWSDMVADENANGAAALPVIDFADISSHVEGTSPPSHTVLSPLPTVQEQSQVSQGDIGVASSSTVSRKPTQTARQAYLTRLDSDPAYVPTLGQFWSHDDRLLDKELRSLSGWWRGRWQGRGRGTRGRGGFATRGREGFAGGWGMRGRGVFGNGGSSRPDDVQEEEIPPAERSWTHDGFEEMKKVEEAQRQEFPFRGKGAFPRGRGGPRAKLPSNGGSFASQYRASSPQTPQTPQTPRTFRTPQIPQAPPQIEPRQSTTSDLLRFGNGTRPWFAMKPERVWTKQFDGYLYFEARLKPVPNQGIGQGVRIKLPGMKGVTKNAEELDNDAVVVRLPQWNSISSWTVPSNSQETLGDRVIIVRLPSNKVLRKEHDVQPPEDVITVAPPPMDEPLPHRSIPVPSYQASPIHEAHQSMQPIVHPPKRTSDLVSNSQPSGSTSAPLNPHVETPFPLEMAFKEATVAYDVTSAGPSQSHGGDIRPQGPDNLGTASPQPPQPPVQPMLQAMASPFQPSPSYGLPYPYPTSGLALPPGIAVSEDGVTYEIATGRTVYLHTPPPHPPPPPLQVPMYNPRPMPIQHRHHGNVHFLPHHAHGHASSMSMSVSPPIFLSSPPIFALPRQSSRVEIRAPGEEKGKEREDAQHPNVQMHQAGSRLAANVNAEPFTPASHAQSHAMGYYSAEAQQQAFDNAQRHHQHQQSMYHSPPYYYPVNADGSTPYGYGQHYAGVEPGQQPQQYDTYGQEPYPQGHTVYY